MKRLLGFVLLMMSLLAQAQIPLDNDVEVEGDITPKDSGTYNIGSEDYRWHIIWVDSCNGCGSGGGDVIFHYVGDVTTNIDTGKSIYLNSQLVQIGKQSGTRILVVDTAKGMILYVDTTWAVANEDFSYAPLFISIPDKEVAAEGIIIIRDTSGGSSVRLRTDSDNLKIESCDTLYVNTDDVLQSLSVSNDTLFISGRNAVVLPPLGGDTIWERAGSVISNVASGYVQIKANADSLNLLQLQGNDTSYIKMLLERGIRGTSGRIDVITRDSLGGVHTAAELIGYSPSGTEWQGEFSLQDEDGTYIKLDKWAGTYFNVPVAVGSGYPGAPAGVTLYVTGSGASGATDALLVVNSAGDTLMMTSNDGTTLMQARIGNRVQKMRVLPGFGIQQVVEDTSGNRKASAYLSSVSDRWAVTGESQTAIMTYEGDSTLNLYTGSAIGHLQVKDDTLRIWCDTCPVVIDNIVLVDQDAFIIDTVNSNIYAGTGYNGYGFQNTIAGLNNATIEIGEGNDLGLTIFGQNNTIDTPTVSSQIFSTVFGNNNFYNDQTIIVGAGNTLTNSGSSIVIGNSQSSNFNSCIIIGNQTITPTADNQTILAGYEWLPHAADTVNIGSIQLPFDTIFTNVMVLDYRSADVTNPPTDAELDAIFGTPATVGNGFQGRVKDSNSNNFYIVTAVGSSWYTFAATLAP